MARTSSITMPSMVGLVSRRRHVCVNFAHIFPRNDVTDYVLCCVLPNKLFIKIILLLFVSIIGKIAYEEKMRCAFKRYVKWALNTKLLLQNCVQNVLRLNNLNPLDSKGNYSATSNNTKLVH